MVSFDELLAAAKSAARPTRDVTVTLDQDVSAKVEALRVEVARLRDVRSDDQRLAAVAPETAEADSLQEQLDELLDITAQSLITLRFTRLPGNVWADITARCPVRLDSPVDRAYGYDMQKACQFAAPLSGVRIDGDDEVQLRSIAAVGNTPAVDEWADLFVTLSGFEFRAIQDAIYDLNEYEPEQRIGSLKKALATRPA